MVCKEEVYLWFQSLKGSKRIETMCTIMNMCFPLELRFYGTCLEDLGRKDFHALKEEENKADDLSEILKIRNIHDSFMRSKAIVLLSLLNSSNRIGARELFKVLSEEIKIETLVSLNIFSEPKQVDQYLLILALAQHHPAFTFEQQSFLSNLTLSIEAYINDLSSRTLCQEPYLSNSYFPDIPPPYAPEKDVYQPHPVNPYRYVPFVQPRTSEQMPLHITSLKVKPSHRKSFIRIRVAWGSSKGSDVFKSPSDLITFHQKIVQLFPNDAKTTHDKCIPSLPQILSTWNKQSHLSEAIITSATEYIQLLNSRLPGYILESDYVRSFFTSSSPNRASFSRNNRNSEEQNEVPPRNSRLRSLTIYNSQMSENSPRHRSENQKLHVLPSVRKASENSNPCPQPSPMISPLESPLSSPYTSPMNSETNSRAPSPWIVSSLPLGSSIHESGMAEKNHIRECHEQWDGHKNLKSEELPPVSELESLVISQDSTKLKELKLLPNSVELPKNPPNGIVGYYLPKGNLNFKPAPPVQSNSNDSSPVGSEYSSPPQSPSPGEACNHSSSLSSGAEEIVDKRPQGNTANNLYKVEESEPIASDVSFKPDEDESNNVPKGGVNRTSVSVIPFAVPYSTIISQMPPPPNVKPAYLPVPCRTNCGPPHLNPGAIMFDNQFSRVPLPSALTFIPGPPRSHGTTPDRIFPTPGLPLSTVTPFPVTSGCATVPSASCSITTQRSNSVTIVTNSGTRHNTKTTLPMREGEIIAKPPPQVTETPYAAGYILNSNPALTAVSCSCYTTNSARPSPSPSPSIISPGTGPSTVPVTMSYLGMPYLFHHSIPFLSAQPPANGFLPQPPLGAPTQGFSYALPNGLTALSPELIYPGQGFALPVPSTQGNPVQTSQCYSPFPPHSAAVPVKLASCYNCGKIGHYGLQCKEQSMDDLNKQGKFQLNYNPLPKMPDSHE